MGDFFIKAVDVRFNGLVAERHNVRENGSGKNFGETISDGNGRNGASLPG